MDPKLEMKPEALQAILDEVSIIDARAKKVSVRQLTDRRYLDEMEKSGFFETLWGTKR
jgi:hypothetical protein